MSLPMQPTDVERAEPTLGRPGPRPAGEAVALRRAAPARPPEAENASSRPSAERPPGGFTAGERIVVASTVTGGPDGRSGGSGLLRLLFFGVLVVLTGVVLGGLGAETFYRAMGGLLRH
jgi:hypothetical protein